MVGRLARACLAGELDIRPVRVSTNSEPLTEEDREAIGEAWATHPDAVVAIAHECPDKLSPMLERHPEWRLAFFGGAHCHKVLATTVNGVALISPGWRQR